MINVGTGYAISRARQNGGITQLGHHLREMLKKRYFTNTHLPQTPFLLNPTLYPLQQTSQSSIKCLFLEESLKKSNLYQSSSVINNSSEDSDRDVMSVWQFLNFSRGGQCTASFITASRIHLGDDARGW